MNVTFTNSGLIPIEAITTLGINVKEGESPIGFFGTGLKYAIAGLLRTNQKITIWRGLERFNFTTKETVVRGKPFQFIFMNDQQLGFTTDLGKTWEMWQVFRELYSNCLDEEGQMSFTTKPARKDQTTIVVHGEAFTDAAYKKNEIFLSTKPIHETDTCEIHEGVSRSLFYRGIKVLEFEQPSVFTYNVKSKLDLTEDRTLKSHYYAYTCISDTLYTLEDESLIKKALMNPNSMEWNLSFPSWNMRESFAKTILALVYTHGEVSVARSAVLAAETFMKEKVEFKPAFISSFELRQIKKACDFLAEIGFEVTEEIIVVLNLGQGISGQARNNKIYLAKSTLDKGGNWLIGTILEEHLHLERGFVDESREFQNFLLDLAIKFARQSLDKEDFA